MTLLPLVAVAATPLGALQIDGSLDSNASALRTFVAEDGTTVLQETGQQHDALPPQPAGIEVGGSSGCLRWIVPDGGLRWVPQEVSIGDHGAAVMAGKFLNEDCLSLYAAGSPHDVFSFFPDDEPFVLRMQTAAAEEAPLVASMLLRQLTGDQSAYLQPTLTVYDSFSTGEPLWSKVFPKSMFNTLPGVRFSHHGEVILGWWSIRDGDDDYIHVEAFRKDGSTISTGRIEGGWVISRAPVLSHDGKRALFYQIAPGELVVYDVIDGEVEYRRHSGGGATGYSMSGDGKRIVAAQSWEFDVLEQNDAGDWTPIFGRSYDLNVRTTYTALDADGDRLAYVIQGATQEAFTVVLHDLAENRELFRHTFSAPGTGLQLHAYGLELDDAGRTLAGISWGDSFDATPEAFVFDESGEILCQADLRGSGLTMDLTSDGEILVVGSKGAHANELASGGDIAVFEARPKKLRVSGMPALGSDLHVDVQTNGEALVLAISDRLLPAPTARGLAIDLSSGPLLLGPFLLTDGSYEADYSVPADTNLVGNAAHIQGAAFSPNAAFELTNKVSLRIVPAR